MKLWLGDLKSVAEQFYENLSITDAEKWGIKSKDYFMPFAEIFERRDIYPVAYPYDLKLKFRSRNDFNEPKELLNKGFCWKVRWMPVCTPMLKDEELSRNVLTPLIGKDYSTTWELRNVMEKDDGRIRTYIYYNGEWVRFNLAPRENELNQLLKCWYLSYIILPL
jgi:hypothetical protein